MAAAEPAIRPESVLIIPTRVRLLLLPPITV
jgi:hypothetical protein